MRGQPTNGVLVLSHQGFSFLEDLAEKIRSKGLSVFILSSSPAPRQSERYSYIEELGDWSRVLNNTQSLTLDHGLSALESLHSENFNVVCCLSVWDGYRCLMAELNARVSAPDISAQTVSLINDKLSMRQHLQMHGLTRTSVQQATPAALEFVLNEIRQQERRIFIKPQRGLASFGAFEVRSDLQWKDVEALRLSINADQEYATVLSEHPNFIFEDYIEGQEFSFEMIVADGVAGCLGIHEKIGLECGNRTTLETVCVSPPQSLLPADLQTGIDYVCQVLKALGASFGCYHVEVRCSPCGHWDVIEVNPRVGGALIAQSVRELSGSACLLDLWLNTLLGHHVELSALETQVLTKPFGTTVFRVFFGQSGRKIASINLADFNPQAKITRVAAKAGEQLQKSDREIFIAQMLWVLPLSSTETEIGTLVKNSQNALEVTYV